MNGRCLITAVAPLPYASVAARVFDGELLKFNCGGRASGTSALLRAARALCREVFSTARPATAHRLYEGEDFFVRAARAQKEFNTAPYKKLFAEWLNAAGAAPDTDELYWDTLGLRIAPPVATHGGGWRSSIGAHRDTWGTAVQSQINWWAPIFPLADGRTMCFYPDYWRRPLANSTSDWSFKDYLESRKKTPAGKATPYPSAPRALAEPDSPPQLVRLRCGELLAFSSAHLHASVPNRTQLTRFSLEIRTVSAAHINSGDGAPNTDCASTPPLYRLFRSIADEQPLSP